MSLFSWFTRKPKTQAPHSRMHPASVHSHPPGGSAAPAAAATELRKTERMERREQLYQAVRDTMVRVGVLSAGYKFKVLSLDQRGAQFLVMVDLTQEYGRDVVRLTEIESLILHAAKTRFDILVTAVYWRVNPTDQFSAAAQPGQKPQVTAPTATAGKAPAAALAPQVAAPRVAPLVPPPLVPPQPAQAEAPAAAAPKGTRPGQRYEPIDADEVAAFKQALARAAASRPTAPPAPMGDSVRTGPILRPSSNTGFEDTVMPDQDGHSSDLSGTQYGELR